MILLRPEAPRDKGDFGPSAYVYEPFVLERTREVLAGQTKIELPQDIETLIEAVYGADAASMGDLASSWLTEYQIATAAQASQAMSVFLPKPSVSNLPRQMRHQLPDDSDPGLAAALRTRLIEPGVTLICVHDRDGLLFLDPDGHEPLPEGPVTTQTARRLLLNSVTLHRYDFVKAVNVRQMQPKEWADSSWLRNCALVEFKNGLGSVGGFSLRVDAEVGLEFTS